MADEDNKADRKLVKKPRKTKIIKYIQHPSGPIVTWLKFIAVMIAASLLMWQLIEKIISYIENPVIVTREINYLTEIPFPGLIVCNSQPLRYSYVQNSPMRQIIDHYISSPESLGHIESKDRLSYHLGRATEINVKDFYMNASQKAEDFIVDCEWRGGERSNCSDADFKLVSTDHGPCYRLDLNTSAWPNLTAAGPADSFQIVLNLDTVDSYQTTSAKSMGAIFALFRYDNPTPIVSHIGFTIPLGFEASISLRSEFVERLERRKKGQCDPDAKLVFFDEYSTAGCYLENKFMRVVNACLCLPYNFPEYRHEFDEKNLTEYLTQFSPCTVEMQFQCADKIWKQTDSMELQNSSCPDSCGNHRYTPTFTYATIAGNQLKGSVDKHKSENIDVNYMRAINAKYNTTGWRGRMNDEEFKDNFVIVNIYFKELLHETIVQHLTYDGWGLVGDIAATIGIILGFLLSTLGEVITNCIWCCNKVRGKSAEIEEESEEESEEDDDDDDDEDESEEEETNKNQAKNKSKNDSNEDVRNRKNLSHNEK